MAARRVVIFSALYMPHLGGVEKFSQSIAAELSNDCEVTVFCMNTESRPEFVKEGSVSVYYLPCIPMQKGRFPVPKPAAYRRVREWFASNEVDFAIVQCRFYLLSEWAVRFLAKKGIRYIQIEHGAGDVVMPNKLVDFIWHTYEKALTESEKRFPHEWFGVSNASIRWLKHYGITGRGVISNSVKPADFTDALANRGSWRREHGIPEDALIISFSGRIMVDKGILELTQAFDRLRGDNLHLVIAGGGDMDLLEPWQGRENIHILGQVDFKDIPRIMADSQIFCLPSRFIEGQPTSLLEAGYCGCAVTATANGGITEVIPSEEYGLLIQTGDVDALTNALQSLIDNPEKRERLGANLQARVREHYTWATAAAKIRAVMDEYGL